MTSSRDAFRPWTPEALVMDGPPAPPGGADGAWCPPPIERPAVPRSAAEARADSARAGYERARAEGERAGYERARAGFETARRALLLAASALEEDRDSFAATRERNLQALSMAVARHVVGRELAADPALVRALVVRAMGLLPPDLPVCIRLHPEDLEGVRATRMPGADSAGEAPVRFAADAAIGRGNFVIESPQRLVDGRTDVALRQLYERFDHV